MNSQRVTISDIVNILFAKPPAEACTYQLLLPQIYNKPATESFHYLMNILIGGAKKLYGQSVTPSDISGTQFRTLEKYMLSLGYQIKYNYTYPAGTSLINIWFEPYTGRKDCHGGVVFLPKNKK